MATRKVFTTLLDAAAQPVVGAKIQFYLPASGEYRQGINIVGSSSFIATTNSSGYAEANLYCDELGVVYHCAFPNQLGFVFTLFPGDPISLGELQAAGAPPSDDQLLTIEQMIQSAINQTGGTDRTYRFVQGVAGAVWDVQHNLSKRPAVTIINSSGDEVEGEVRHLDENNVQISFSAAFAGEAFFN